MPTVNVDDAKLALKGYCPVSYQHGGPVQGDEKYSSEYGGAVYRFASAQGKSMFDADPKKYEPMYGGYCSFGMTMGALVPVDPLNHKIVDGHLHVFKNQDGTDTLPMWNQDEEGNKAKAANMWTETGYDKA